jgi:hypothetical protein
VKRRKASGGEGRLSLYVIVSESFIAFRINSAREVRVWGETVADGSEGVVFFPQCRCRGALPNKKEGGHPRVSPFLKSNLNLDYAVKLAITGASTSEI